MDESDILHVKHLISTYGRDVMTQLLLEVGLLTLKDEPKQIESAKK